jgi:hypothetical protein
MLPVLAYGLGLLLSAGLACTSHVPGMRRTGAAMIANWFGVLVAVTLSESVTPWMLFIALDLASALVILRNPSGRPQAIIGTIYLFQITFHVAYALVGSAAASLLYLDLLALGGWLQLVTLLWGTIHGGGMRYSDHHAGGRLPATDSPHLGRVGPRR